MFTAFGEQARRQRGFALTSLVTASLTIATSWTCLADAAAPRRINAPTDAVPITADPTKTLADAVASHLSGDSLSHAIVQHLDEVSRLPDAISQHFDQAQRLPQTSAPPRALAQPRSFAPEKEDASILRIVSGKAPPLPSTDCLAPFRGKTADPN